MMMASRKRFVVRSILLLLLLLASAPAFAQSPPLGPTLRVQSSGVSVNMNTHTLNFTSGCTPTKSGTTTSLACGAGSSSTLQSAYTQGGAGGGVITVTASGAGVLVKDAATPIGATLLGAQTNAGTPLFAAGVNGVASVDGNGTSPGYSFISQANMGMGRTSLNHLALTPNLSDLIVITPGSGGNASISTGPLTTTGATALTGSLTQSGGALSLTSTAAGTVTTTVGTLTLDAAAAVKVGQTNATGVGIATSGTLTSIAGGVLLTSVSNVLDVDYVVDSVSKDAIVYYATKTNPHTVTLPSPSSASVGRLITIKNGTNNTGALTISSALNSIDGSTTQSTSTAWGSITVVGSSTTTWSIISKI